MTTTLRKRVAVVFAAVYGLGFPLWVAATTTMNGSLGVSEPLLAALVAVWGGCAVFFIGRDSLTGWIDTIRGGDEA